MSLRAGGWYKIEAAFRPYSQISSGCVRGRQLIRRKNLANRCFHVYFITSDFRACLPGFCTVQVPWLAFCRYRAPFQLLKRFSLFGCRVRPCDHLFWPAPVQRRSALGPAGPGAPGSCLRMCLRCTVPERSPGLHAGPAGRVLGDSRVVLGPSRILAGRRGRTRFHSFMIRATLIEASSTGWPRYPFLAGRRDPGPGSAEPGPESNARHDWRSAPARAGQGRQPRGQLDLDPLFLVGTRAVSIPPFGHLGSRAAPFVSNPPYGPTAISARRRSSVPPTGNDLNPCRPLALGFKDGAP